MKIIEILAITLVKINNTIQSIFLFKYKLYKANKKSPSHRSDLNGLKSRN
jgi:hypothetical protein